MADQPITTFERAQETAQFLAQRLEDPLRHPKVAIVCGSGLGGLADAVHASPRVEIDYASIPHFGRTTGVWQLCGSLIAFDHDRSPTSSRGPCREVAIWDSGRENTRCIDGGTHAVGWAFSDLS